MALAPWVVRVLPVTSPTAQMPGTFVRPQSSASMPRRVWAMPAVSRCSRSSFGARPTASSTTSTSSMVVPSARWATSVAASKRSIDVPVRTSTPRSTRAASTAAETSGYSSASRRSRSSTRATSLPMSLKAVAISSEIGPPPTSRILLGGASRSNSSSFVSSRSDGRPSIGNLTGCEPAAMITCSARTSVVVPSWSATSTTWGSRRSVNVAQPWRSVICSWWSISRVSSSRRWSRRARVQPKGSASPTAAAWSSAFDGMQPTFVQSPPTSPPSTSTTSWPKPARPMAIVRPPEPAPMTTALWVRSSAFIVLRNHVSPSTCSLPAPSLTHRARPRVRLPSHSGQMG